MDGTVFRRLIRSHSDRIGSPEVRANTDYPRQQIRICMAFWGSGTTFQYAFYQWVEY